MCGEYTNAVYPVRLQPQKAQARGGQSPRRTRLALRIGDLDLAVECKATPQVDERHTTGLRALLAEQPVKNAIVVSLDSVPRQLSGGIMIYPWQIFCQKLWAGDFT